MDLSNVRLQLATISSPRNEPNVSTFCRGGGKRRLDVVEVAEDGVGVERGGRETAAGAGGGGGCWEDTWDEGGTTPPTPWGEAVEARCRGDDSPPATTKKTHKGPREHERVNCLDGWVGGWGVDGDRETFFHFFFLGGERKEESLPAESLRYSA